MQLVSNITLGLEGQIKRGGLLSWTSIKNEQEVLLLLESATSKVIWFEVPMAKGVPTAGVWVKM